MRTQFYLNCFNVRYGDQPEVRGRLTRAIEDGMDRPHLQELLENRALTHDAMDASTDMEQTRVVPG
jgi:hypothetical protein